MEELINAILNVVKDTPSIAVWILVIIYGFKVAIVGSIFGVLRLAIIKAHDYAVTPTHKLVRTDYEATLAGMTISNAEKPLTAQLNRIAGIRAFSSDTYATQRGVYIHAVDVQWLTEAIDAKLNDARNQQER